MLGRAQPSVRSARLQALADLVRRSGSLLQPCRAFYGRVRREGRALEYAGRRVPEAGSFALRRADAEARRLRAEEEGPRNGLCRDTESNPDRKTLIGPDRMPLLRALHAGLRGRFEIHLSKHAD